ncbi:MAG TPA: methionyl-tRNA formyltransferase [Bacteroidales bacterium]|nr:methionyl-tRNA formyltransferase [Bacteroidales bacterium]
MILVSEKQWHLSLYDNLKKSLSQFDILLINKKDDFCFEKLIKINPYKIFLPHWSYIISEEIYSKFECVVFHMTDLPFGRGGSPLQNLIANGFQTTMLSALMVQKGIDSGPIYLKKKLKLNGSAKQIFNRSAKIVEKMIVEIIEKDIIPKPQLGEAVIFKRRTPEESNICQLDDLDKIYDYIRMLDCEGYPNAFIETEKMRYEFYDAKLRNNKIDAKVRIFRK